MTDEPGKYYPICSRCGEEMKAHQYAPAPGVCTDCYSIYDMDRFREWEAKREAQNDRKKD
jgi:hypothetical protein